MRVNQRMSMRIDLEVLSSFAEASVSVSVNRNGHVGVVFDFELVGETM